MKGPFRTLVIGAGPRKQEPWWWKYIEHDTARCQLDYEIILLKGGRLSSIFSPRFATLFVRFFSVLRRARNKYHYIFTFECGWPTFIVAFIQTVTGCHRPRHVILQFIMREKNQSFRSRLKYLFMTWCFSSVYRCVCSSRAEACYYGEAFQWPKEKLDYIPFHTDPGFLSHEGGGEEGFIISAGRTFRDYRTLLDAFKDLNAPLIIIASRSNIELANAPPNVTIQYDIPTHQLTDLMSRSLAVVLPLEERMISTGQSVLLRAMALGKVVIATKVNGTEDYIEHLKTGIFVPPNDPDAIRAAVAMLIDNKELRSKIGRAARDRVKEGHLPEHYAKAVSLSLQ